MHKKLFIGTLAGVMLCGLAHAAEIDYSVSDINAGKILITGTAPFDEGREWITVSVLNPGYSSADSNEAVNCLKQTKLIKNANSSEGDFSANIQLKNPVEDTYKVLVNYYGAESLIEKNINYYPETVLLDKCELIAQAIKNKNINELKNVLSQDDVMNFLGIRQSLLKAAAFNDVCEAVIKNVGGKDIEKNIERIRRIYEEQASIIIIESEAGADFIQALRGAESKTLTDVLKGDYQHSAAYTMYCGLSDGLASTVAQNVASKTYKNGTELNKSFEFEILNESIKNAQHYLEVRKVMTEYKDVFLNSWEGLYNSLTSAQQANAETALIAKVKSGTQTTTDAIGDLFIQAINEQKKVKKPQGASSGGGSNGSKNGNALPSVAVSVAQNQELLSERDIWEKPPFIDLDSVSWAVGSITELEKRGVLSGRSKLVFEPASTVLREEFIKMAVMGFDISSETPECSFDDVMNADWFREYVAIAVSEGIINGINESFFGSGMNIKRCDIAVILYRIAKEKGISLTGEVKAFADENEIPDYAKEAISMLSAAGVINGNEKYEFLPYANATRAEAAKMIYELLMISEKAEG